MQPGWTRLSKVAINVPAVPDHGDIDNVDASGKRKRIVELCSSYQQVAGVTHYNLSACTIQNIFRRTVTRRCQKPPRMEVQHTLACSPVFLWTRQSRDPPGFWV